MSLLTVIHQIIHWPFIIQMKVKNDFLFHHLSFPTSERVLQYLFQRFTKPLSKVKIIMLRCCATLHTTWVILLSVSCVMKKNFSYFQTANKKTMKMKRNVVLCENDKRSTSTCEWGACPEQIFWNENHFPDLRIVIPCLHWILHRLVPAPN